MALFVMATPVPDDKMNQWYAFLEQLRGPRGAEFRASRQKAGVRERTFLQRTPHGNLVIVTLEGDDPANAFARMASTNDDFTRWFLKQVKDVHGIDLKAPLPGPPPEMVIDSGE